jgi:hypothetical protein
MIVDAHPLAIQIASDWEYRALALVPDTYIDESVAVGRISSELKHIRAADQCAAAIWLSLY